MRVALCVQRCTVHAVTAVPPYTLHLIVLTLLLHTCSIVVPFVAWSLLHYLYTVLTVCLQRCACTYSVRVLVCGVRAGAHTTC
jgi:hypothetical protein